MTADDPGARLLRQLAEGGPIAQPVALIVAHPDDEVIAAGGSLARFLNLTLIHVTDGACDDRAYLQAVGAPSRQAYAATRRAELDAALHAAWVRPLRRLCYGLADGEVAAAGETLTQRLAADMMSVDAVLTHAYEGGHVDHDAIARAVHDAAGQLRALTGRAPSVLEFAGYWSRSGKTIAGRFRPGSGGAEAIVHLSVAARQRREAAFACFASQSYNLRYFLLNVERFRLAPQNASATF